MLDRILVALDGSREAESVLPTLRRLLKRRDAELVLFQAIDLPLTVQAEHAPTVLLGLQNDADAHLEKWRAELESAGARVRVHKETGRPADAILKAARDLDVSLIAMSTHGRSGVARWMMGSVTEDVLRRSDRPVLVAHGPEEVRPAPAGTRTILVPFDGSEQSLEVVPLAIECAKLYQAGVAILRVEEGAAGCDLGFVGLLMEGPSSLEGRPDLLDRDLIAAGNRFAAEGLRTTLFRVRGDTAAKINHLARILPAELIVMATHGRQGVSRLITGSVAEEVVRRAESPVVVRRIGSEPALVQ
jgi:nucleotide-binding universal stress UspA family protein